MLMSGLKEPRYCDGIGDDGGDLIAAGVYQRRGDAIEEHAGAGQRVVEETGRGSLKPLQLRWSEALTENSDDFTRSDSASFIAGGVNNPAARDGRGGLVEFQKRDAVAGQSGLQVRKERAGLRPRSVD
jgi:hypothetical protein